MNKKRIITTFTSFVVLVTTLFIFILVFGNEIKYLIATDCLKNEKWDCAIAYFKKLESDNYKDSSAKLLLAQKGLQTLQIKSFDDYYSRIQSISKECINNIDNSDISIDSVNSSINLCKNAQDEILKISPPKVFNKDSKNIIDYVRLISADLCYHIAYVRKLQYESSVNPSIYEHSNIKNMIIDNKARMVGGLLFRDRIRYDLEEFNKLTPYNSYNTALDYDSVVQPIEKINLQVIKTFKCTDEYSYGYGKYICGVLKNNTTSAYYNINLIFDLIDSQGNIVDETSTSLKKMAPNATWNFKAIILDENITSWQLSNIEYNNSYNLNN